MHICRKIVIICNSEEISKIERDNLVIYIGTHGCETALYADIIFGLPALPEHRSINITSNGKILKTDICYLSPLSDIVDISNYSLLNYETIYSKPLFLIIDYNLILRKNDIIYEEFNNNITNFSRSLVLLDHIKKGREYNWLL